MSNREKLIELCKTLLNSWAISPESAADFFLSNGVTVPKHGRWSSYLDGDDIMPARYFSCSKCGSRGHQLKWHYCPNCGAKMDLKENK